MKAPKTISTASNLHIQNKQETKPFFERSGESMFSNEASSEAHIQTKPFFSKNSDTGIGYNIKPPPFFTPNLIQAKLTIGQPNDKYEQEADAMADEVVQKLAEPNAAPSIQTKCDTCEEEKINKKEIEEEVIQEQAVVEQEEAPDISTSIDPVLQLKCNECDEEEEIQKKAIVEENEKDIQEKPIAEIETLAEVQMKVEPNPISIPDPIVAAPTTITNINTTETPVQKEEQEQELEESTDDIELQQKPIFDSAEDPPEEELVMTKSESNEFTTSNSIEQQLGRSKGSGSPLPDDTRSSMESAIGADFSGVNIHTGSDAVEMNKGLGAQAFTHGNDIYFNEGKYDTNSSSGNHLLAHELTHTVQQRAAAPLDKIQRQLVDDPNKRIDEIFNEGGGRDFSKVPIKYWSAYWHRGWLDNFIEFLKVCQFDPSSLDEKHLVYMGLLYSTMSKKFTGWSGGTFVMESSDSLGGKLSIYFSLPTIDSNEMQLSIDFSTLKDTVYLESTTPVFLSAFHTLEALDFSMPNTDISNLYTTFDYPSFSGAYEGTSAKFSLNYVLFSPHDPLKLQSIYFHEKIDFGLVTGDSISVSFEGRFDIPLHLSLLQQDIEHIESLLPKLIRNGINIENSVGGSQMIDDDFVILIFGFSDEKKRVISIQQLLEPTVSDLDRSEYIVYNVLNFIESFKMQDVFIDENSPPISTTYDTLKEARAGTLTANGRGHIIVEEDQKYTLYLLTTADLIWLAKKQRGEETANIPRYQGLDIMSIVDAQFYELPIDGAKSVRGKLDELKFAYFSNPKELKEYAIKYFSYFLSYRLRSGFYCALQLHEETTSSIWQIFDDNNKITKILLNGLEFDAQALYLRSDKKDLAILLIINDEHYEGRTQFAELYKKVKTANAIDDIKDLGKDKKSSMMTYLKNEFLRPTFMNPDQELKEALQELQSPESMLTTKIGELAFGMVAGEVESKGLEMMESMLSFMDELVKDDMLMKMMLMSFKGREQQEKKDIASIFTEDEAQAKKLINIMDNDESMHAFLMNNTIDDLSLTIVAGNLKKSRDEILEAVNDRRELHKNPSIRYEVSFIVQPGELGNDLRKHAYDVFGFDLDPTKFPHPEHVNTSLFPSPLHEGGKEYTNLLEQLYINGAVNISRKYKTLKTVQTVAMVASVFSLARGAGLWAVSRAGLAAGTKSAIVLEALVTSIAAGVMLEGIQVAMGKKFSWADLGLTIGEAFVLMLTFGWVNSLFKLPITRFTVNALLFVGYGVGRFYVSKKRMPNGFEFNLIVLESILMITLLHIGTKLTDPFFRRVLKLNGHNAELKAIRENMEKMVEQIAIEAAKQSPNRARSLELGEQFMEYVKQYREWIETNQAKFSEADVKAELAKIDQLSSQWAEAKFMDATQLSMVAQTKTVFYYKPGANSAKALKEKYGEENVKIDEKSGFGTVETAEGTFKLIPENVADSAASAAAKGERLTDIFGNNIRLLDLGIYAYRRGFNETIRDYVVKENKGKWYDLGNKVFAGEIGGRKVIFIEEASTATLEFAMALEGKVKGGGMEYLSKSWTDSAQKGFDLLKASELRGRTNMEILDYLKQISQRIEKSKYPKGLDGQPIKPRPKSLTQYLEKLFTESKMKEISEFRKNNDIVPYKQSPGSTGTIAMIEPGGKPYYGANSTLTNSKGEKIRSLSQSEIDAWIKKLTDAGKITELREAEFLYHAEAEALIKAHNDKVQFPEEVTLYVDRPTCAKACRKHLGGLIDLMGIKRLRIHWLNAKDAPGIIIKAH